MENANKLKQKLQQGQFCLGVGISFNDAAVTEALCRVYDFAWIDTEHNGMTLERVEGHIVATRATGATSLVRVPWNDPVLVKPVLDLGADGVIFPMIRTAEDVRNAVAACRYPPEGIRGYGPRRPTHFARAGGSDYCKKANQTVLTVVQIETAEAVENLDAILAVPGLTSVVIGPNDLSGSLGHMADPGHPDVVKVIESIIARVRDSSVFVGIAVGSDPKQGIRWMEQGAHWLQFGVDFGLMVERADKVCGIVRDHAKARQNG
jgi:2-dehydro-3-deoxyglucarate aldolase/4-hydroxy-2-oxoheptanedioate aldolase